MDNKLINEFATFINNIEYSVERSESPEWVALCLTAEEADSLLPVLQEILKQVQEK